VNKQTSLFGGAVDDTNAKSTCRQNIKVQDRAVPPERQMSIAQLGILEPRVNRDTASFFQGSCRRASCELFDRPVFCHAAPIRIEVRIKVPMARDRDGCWNAILPLTALPRLPPQLRLYCHMGRPVRRIAVMNLGYSLHTVLRGPRAMAIVENTPRAPLRRNDYVFVWAIELGDPIAPQCADPLTLFILVTFVAMLVFTGLTNGLVDQTF